MHAVASKIAESEAMAAATIAAARAHSAPGSSSGAGGASGESSPTASSNTSVPGLVKAVSKRLSIFGGPKHEPEKPIAIPITRPVTNEAATTASSPPNSSLAHSPTNSQLEGPMRRPTSTATSPTIPAPANTQPATAASIPPVAPQPTTDNRQSILSAGLVASKTTAPAPASHPVLSAELSPAQARLLAHIGEGITIVKHGKLSIYRIAHAQRSTLICNIICYV